MRLPEATIKELLLHPDRDVRDVALVYFEDTGDPGVMPLAIRALEQYGRAGAFTHTNPLPYLPQTEATLAWALAELQRDAREPPEEVYFYHLNLSRLMCQADVRLVAARAPEVLHARHFSPTQQTAFQERLEMFGWPADRCWDELQRFCEAHKDAEDFTQLDLGHALRVVETLAGRAGGYEGQVLAELGAEAPAGPGDARWWLQPLLAILAGKMRLAAAVPLLARHLGHRHGYLADQCMYALGWIGGDAVVAEVCEPFPRASRDYRQWTAELLGRVHGDAAVGRLVGLLAGERDPGVRRTLCESLLEQFSPEGVEPAREAVRQVPPSPNVSFLQWLLVATCQALGVRFPEFDAWREESGRSREAERASSREVERVACAEGGDLERVALQLEIRRLQAEIAENRRLMAMMQAHKRQQEAQVSVVRSRAGAPAPPGPGRVGRNDPCPCGSGKKFKQCCRER